MESAKMDRGFPASENKGRFRPAAGINLEKLHKLYQGSTTNSRAMAIGNPGETMKFKTMLRNNNPNGVRMSRNQSFEESEGFNQDDDKEFMSKLK
jgi:hypothetical protein